MLMNNNKKEKKEPFSYELFPSENNENTFNVDEGQLAEDTSSGKQPVGQSTVTAPKPEKAPATNLLGSEWEASKRRIDALSKRWSAKPDQATGNARFKNSFASYMLPKDTPARRRKIYSLSQEALDDVVDEYYNKELKSSFMQHKDEAKARGKKALEENAYLAAEYPMQLYATVAKEEDPAKVIEKSMAHVDNARLKELVSPMASTGGYDADKYIEDFVRPSLQNRMLDEYVKESVPKNRGEYIVRSAVGNSLIGKLAQLSASGEKGVTNSLAIEQEGLSKYKSNRVDDFVAGVGALMIDAPAFSALGSSSSAMLSLAGRKVMPLLTKRIAQSVLNKSINSRMNPALANMVAERAIKENIKYKIANAALGQGLTLGKYDISNSIVDDLLVGNEVDSGKAAKSFGRGMLLGGVSSLASSPFRVLSKGAGGARKLFYSSGVLSSESAVFTAGHEIEKLANGVEVAPVDLFYDFSESAATLLTMRLSHWRPKGKEYKLNRYGKIRKEFDLTPVEREEIRNIGCNATELVRDIEKELAMPNFGGFRSRARIRNIYADIMASKDVSASAKSKLMFLVDNKLTSSPPVPFDYDIFRLHNGKYKVKLFDYDGHLIESNVLSDEIGVRSSLMIMRPRILKNRIEMYNKELISGIRSRNFYIQAKDYIAKNNVDVEEFTDAVYNRLQETEVSPRQQKIINDVLRRSSYDSDAMIKYLYSIRRNIERKYGLDGNSLLYVIEKKPYMLSKNEINAIEEYEFILRNEVERLKAGTSSSHAREIDNAASGVLVASDDIIRNEYSDYNDYITMQDYLGTGEHIVRPINVLQKPKAGVVWNYYNNVFTQEKLEEHKAFAKEFSNKLGVDIELITDERQIKVPEAGDTDAILEYNNQVKAYGWVVKGKVYINLPNCKGLEDVEKTIVHEVVGHYGLEKVFGYHLRDFIEELYSRSSDDVRSEINKIRARYPHIDHYSLVEEYLADVIEKKWKNSEERTMLQRFKEFINRMFARLGIYYGSKKRLSSSEVEELLALHCNYVRNKVDPVKHRKKVFGRFKSSHLPEIEYNDYDAYLQNINKQVSEGNFFKGTPSFLKAYKAFLNYDRLDPNTQKIFREQTKMSEEEIMKELEHRKYRMPSDGNSHAGEKTISGERSGAVPGNSSSGDLHLEGNEHLSRKPLTQPNGNANIIPERGDVKSFYDKNVRADEFLGEKSISGERSGAVPGNSSSGDLPFGGNEHLSHNPLTQPIGNANIIPERGDVKSFYDKNVRADELFGEKTISGERSGAIPGNSSSGDLHLEGNEHLSRKPLTQPNGNANIIPKRGDVKSFYDKNVRADEFFGEKSISGERSGAIPGNSSSGDLPFGGNEHLSHNPLTQPNGNANIIQKTRNAKLSAKKFLNRGEFRGRNRAKDAVRIIGNALNLVKSKNSQSFYEDLLVDGKIVRIRISTHEATNIRMGNAAADEKISIVIKKDGTHKDRGNHNGYTEYIYDPKDISPERAAHAIVRSIHDLIANGKYVDYSGKAIRTDYPYYDNGKIRYRLPGETGYGNGVGSSLESHVSSSFDNSPVVRTASLGELLDEPALLALHPFLGNIAVEVLEGSSLPASYDADENMILIGGERVRNGNITEQFVPAISDAVDSYAGRSAAVERNSRNIRENIKREYDAIGKDLKFIESMKARQWRDSNESRLSGSFKEKYGISPDEFKDMFPTVDEYLLYRLSGKRLLPTGVEPGAVNKLSGLKKNFNGPLDILTGYNASQHDAGVDLSRVAERLDDARLTSEERAELEDALEAYAMQMLYRMKPGNSVGQGTYPLAAGNKSREKIYA